MCLAYLSSQRIDDCLCFATLEWSRRKAFHELMNKFDVLFSLLGLGKNMKESRMKMFQFRSCLHCHRVAESKATIKISLRQISLLWWFRSLPMIARNNLWIIGIILAMICRRVLFIMKCFSFWRQLRTIPRRVNIFDISPPPHVAIVNQSLFFLSFSSRIKSPKRIPSISARSKDISRMPSNPRPHNATCNKSGNWSAFIRLLSPPLHAPIATCRNISR